MVQKAPSNALCIRYVTLSARKAIQPGGHSHLPSIKLLNLVRHPIINPGITYTI